MALDIASWSPRMLSVLRIMTGLLFLEHGTQKFFAFPAPGPDLTPLLVVQGSLELVGGVLMVIGLFTRPAAFILAGDMAVAYFMRHAPRGFFLRSTVASWRYSIALYFSIFSWLAAAFGASTRSGRGRVRGEQALTPARVPFFGAEPRSSPSSQVTASPRSTSRAVVPQGR
jgi:putative oxidoreductase